MISEMNSKAAKSFFLYTIILMPVLVLAQTLQKVKVVPLESGQPGVNMDKDLNDVGIRPLLECIPADVQQRYPGTVAANENQAICRSGYMQATLLSNELLDVQNSLSEINKRIVSLQNTLDYLNKIQDLHGFKIYGIPAGTIGTKDHEYAANIGMMCLVSKYSGAKGVSAIGNLAKEGVPNYEQVGKEQIAEIEKFKKENQALDNKLKTEISQKGKIGKGTIVDLAKKVSGLRNVMTKNLIMVLPEDVNNYPAIVNSGNYLSIILNYNKDSNNQTVMHSLPLFLRALLPIFHISDKQFVDASISLGGVQYPEVWIPEQTMLKGMREDTEKHMMRMKELKSEFQKIREDLARKTTDLQNKNYNCK